MAATIYHQGDKIRFTLANQDANGAYVDPSGSVQLQFQFGNQAKKTKNYPADGIIRDGAGQYHYDYDTSTDVISARSVVASEWINTGTGQSIGYYAQNFIDSLPI